MTARVERLSWTRGNTKAALKARLIINAHGLIVDINTVSWANVQASRACLGFSRSTPKAAVGVWPGDFFVVHWLKRLVCVWINRQASHQRIKRIRKHLQGILNINEVVEKISVLVTILVLSHGASSPLARGIAAMQPDRYSK